MFFERLLSKSRIIISFHLVYLTFRALDAGYFNQPVRILALPFEMATYLHRSAALVLVEHNSANIFGRFSVHRHDDLGLVVGETEGRLSEGIVG